MANLSPGLTLALFVFVLVVSVLWVVLPFAVFGIEALLKDVLDALRENNRLLSLMANEGEATAASDGVAPFAEPSQRGTGHRLRRG